MRITITPHALKGTLPAIASKSMAHRLLILAALCPQTTDLDCNTTSKDIDATVACLEALGARIARTRKGFRVNPIVQPKPDALLDCGESGSTLRFMMPLLAALGQGGALAVHGRLAERPLSPLYEELCLHGATLGKRGTWPLVVGGTLRGGTFGIPGNVSSQYVSGILMAAPLVGETVRIRVEEPFESSSYVNLTISALKTFGIRVGVSHEQDGEKPHVTYAVDAGQKLVSPGVASVEGDWSNAAFWLAAGAFGGQGITIEGLDPASIQGDRACIAALAAFGARITRAGHSITCRHDDLTGRTIDVGDIPDLVPPLAAIATQAKGTTRIINAGRLRLKESDRLETVCAGLRALGATVSIIDDSLVVEGTGALCGGTVDAANDHRIAMMGAIAGTYAQGETTILGAECVSKSYPGFFEDFRTLGGIAAESEA